MFPGFPETLQKQPRRQKSDDIWGWWVVCDWGAQVRRITLLVHSALWEEEHLARPPRIGIFWNRGVPRITSKSGLAKKNLALWEEEHLARPGGDPPL